MRIVEQNVELMTDLDGDAILKHLERCGRVCYKSEDKITDESAKAFVKMLIDRGHESVLEHYSITVKFICDRGISHEIVRHRLASYSHESTRYCCYGNDKFGGEITVIDPHLDEGERLYWELACRYAEIGYFNLLADGVKPQIARNVLPTSLKTELIMTANIREWRHFMKMRCSVAAHPQMRQLAFKLLKMLHDKIPVCFDDLWEEYNGSF